MFTKVTWIVSCWNIKIYSIFPHLQLERSD